MALAITDRSMKRAGQQEVLALLLALAAIVLPLSGAVIYLDPAYELTGVGRWQAMAIGASTSADLLGPTLLVGGLALGAVSVHRGASNTVPVPILAASIVVAAVLEAAAFAVSAVDLVRPGYLATPPGTAWDLARYSVSLRLVVQGVVCVAVVVVALRWAAGHRAEAVR